jgi:hypothetical protein
MDTIQMSCTLNKLFASEVGCLRGVPRGSLCCTSRYKKWVTEHYYLLCKLYVERNGDRYWLWILVVGTWWRSNEGRFCGILKYPPNFSFSNPYSVDAYGSDQFRIILDEEIITYSSLFQILTEATTNLPIYTLKAWPNASSSPTYLAAKFKI